MTTLDLLDFEFKKSNNYLYTHFLFYYKDISDIYYVIQKNKIGEHILDKGLFCSSIFNRGFVLKDYIKYNLDEFY